MDIHLKRDLILLMALLLSVNYHLVSCEESDQKNDNKLITSNSNNRMYLCLNNCALCVRQWETGLYNGEKCAKKCLKLKANPRIVDPDCNAIKFFNHKFIKRKNKRH